MTDHVHSLTLDHDDGGWDTGTCSCGEWRCEPVPGADIVGEMFADHVRFVSERPDPSVLFEGTFEALIDWAPEAWPGVPSLGEWLNQQVRVVAIDSQETPDRAELARQTIEDATAEHAATWPQGPGFQP
jgi:hypothetical protein